MQLNEIQKKFRDIMLDHPRALENPPEDFSALFDEGDIALPERLKVYRNNVVGSLSEMIINTFPLVDNLVGRDFMRGMARSFVLEHPPQAGCLNDYGAGFDRFIAGFEPAKGLPYLPDVAALEIALNGAYNAADDRALTAQMLAATAPEDLPAVQLKLRSSVKLISSHFPLDKIRAFCLRSDNQDGQTLDIGQGGVMLMIYRPALNVEITALKVDEFAMLKNLQAGHILGTALEDTITIYSDFDFQHFLQHHLALETFSAFS